MALYPLVFFDALRIKIRDEGLVRNKAVYLALGVMADGTKDILGLWIETSEGSEFWLRTQEPRHRRYSHCCGRRAEGLSGGDQRRFSRHRGALAKNDRLDARLIAEYVATMP